MKLKHSSNSASQTLTSSDTRMLVRETLRISANLASAPPPSGMWRLRTGLCSKIPASVGLWRVSFSIRA
ncbi:UNVERIFIED_CONTAM: hypothetical protein Slati_3242500 [Sesamum latifolium]|uniref:Protein root UVB sensitive 6 N-terminal domain-containing protein n=1 Tax=Sesamum latifolium TaxID=2727402 RepID=A0AAW2UYN9_9LAMI